MPVLRATLTWATAVDPVFFGAHFEAYVNLKPTIHMLRLCNRFGQGERAAVTRLPKELIVMIEGYLTSMERKKQLKAWIRDFRCWESRCDTEDHFTRKKLKKAYNECMYELGGYSSQLSPKETELALEFLAEDGEDERMHAKRRESWESKAESFSKHKKILLEDFGLLAWISHTQPSRLDKDQHEAYGIVMSTEAYLALPHPGKVTKAFGQPQEDPYFDDYYDAWQPTEIGYGVGVAMPNRPSEESLKRFPRIMRILGLTALKKGRPSLYASNEDVDNEETDQGANSQSEAGLGEGEEDSSMPALRLLMSCTTGGR